MIQLALFTGLGLLGYILATQEKNKNKVEQFSDLSPLDYTDGGDMPVILKQAQPGQGDKPDQGHNNMVPYFGSKMTQSNKDSSPTILDTYIGTGKEHFQKREVNSFFDIKPGTSGSPFGQPNESDFYQSRMVTGMRMNNVSPIERVIVGPGINDGYTNLPSGGYQQFNETQQYIKPRTTDEMRTANKPKLSYDVPVIPGAHYITNPGVQAPVKKNRPDTFGILVDKDGNMPYLLTTGGAQVAPASFPQQMHKEQQRETSSKAYYGSGGASFTFSAYVRAFTEPFEQFMKLTVGEYFGISGNGASEGMHVVDPYLAAYTNPGREASIMTDYQAPGYVPIHSGEASMGAYKTNKDENILVNPRQFVDPANVVGTASSLQHMGVQKSKEPLEQDIEMARMTPDILDAFRNNPYTQSLQSV